MGKFNVRMALFAAIGGLAVAPAAHAWVLTTPQNPVQAPSAPGIVPIGYVTLDTPSEEVAWDCDAPTVEVLVGSAYWHDASRSWRRNLGLDVNPPSSASSATCELHDAAGRVTRISIEFTGLGIDIAFTGAG